jgi:hypothetical protein
MTAQKKQTDLFGLPPQITRIVLLTLGIIGSYFFARFILTPPSFGQYGIYRGRAIFENRARPLAFSGQDACLECHEDVVATMHAGGHLTLSCESCHGPSLVHATDPEIDVVAMLPNRCVRCHSSDPVRPEWMAQIDLDDHYDEENCMECHLPHQPEEFPE